MAMTPKERKQAQLEREREERARLTDATYPHLATPFFKRLEDDENWSSVEQCFDLLGIDPPVFEDDRGPEAFASDVCFKSDEDRTEAFQSSRNSIGRAEVMVEMFLDAALELSGIINRYKQDEVGKRLSELEAADLTDKDKRSEALRAAAELSKLLEELKKNTRRTFPVWRVKLL